MVRWTQVADEPDNERYILLCIYIIGIAKGLHLEAMLSLFAVVLVIYFRKYEVTLKTFTIMAVCGIIAYFLIIDLIAGSLPAYLAGHSASRNEAQEFTINNSFPLQVFTWICIIGTFVVFVQSYRKKRTIPALISLALVLALFSFTSYLQVLIRANSDTPMNQNAPKTMSVLSSYIRREQYGNAPT